MTTTVTLMNDKQIEAILRDAAVATKIGICVGDDSFVVGIMIEKVVSGEKQVQYIPSGDRNVLTVNHK